MLLGNCPGRRQVDILRDAGSAEYLVNLLRRGQVRVSFEAKQDGWEGRMGVGLVLLLEKLADGDDLAQQTIGLKGVEGRVWVEGEQGTSASDCSFWTE